MQGAAPGEKPSFQGVQSLMDIVLHTAELSTMLKWWQHIIYHKVEFPETGGHNINLQDCPRDSYVSMLLSNIEDIKEKIEMIMQNGKKNN